MADILMRAEHLSKYFPIRSAILKREVGRITAVSDVSFELERGRTLGVVGESGCGKTTLGRVLMKIYEPTSGRIEFDGEDITRLDGARKRKNRMRMQMVFQDPYSSLNPRMRTEEIVAEPLWVNDVMSKKQAFAAVGPLLETVGLHASDARKYPHEFSGGQRQRISIARAIAIKPDLIVADEAVSALDVSIQAQILNLLSDLRAAYGSSYLFISHNLAVIRHISDQVAVMYLGEIVEMAETADLFARPLHPYTQALLSAAPVADRNSRKQRILLTGDIPSPSNPPRGCAFHPRCPWCMDVCRTEKPEERIDDAGHRVRCHL
ncbi:MAG: dipeptide ABC transporter ATP-binding protein [Clostridiales bacterium]|nr:dipeptide ABC transporter ATP-binding protein [Clostridiales bacterium]